MRIGLISDTHGRLRPEVLTHFEGVELILHAGDIGDLDVLDALGAVAPVKAVFGNTDRFAIRSRLRDVIQHEADGRNIVVVHGDRFGTPTPERLHEAWPAADIVVFGHTHKPTVEFAGGTLCVNPGAAGPPRFNPKPSIAILDTAAEPPSVRLIELG